MNFETLVAQIQTIFRIGASRKLGEGRSEDALGNARRLYKAYPISEPLVTKSEEIVSAGCEIQNDNQRSAKALRVIRRVQGPKRGGIRYERVERSRIE